MRPEDVASSVLQNVGWDGTIPIDPRRIAACYGIQVLPDESLLGGTNSGRCVITDEGDRIIIVNPVDSPVRRNFTVAHELGHAFLHGTGVHARQSKPLTKYRQEETQANRFAAALLMPEDQVRDAFHNNNLEQLALLFGVSQTAMRIRLERLGLVNTQYDYGYDVSDEAF